MYGSRKYSSLRAVQERVRDRQRAGLTKYTRPGRYPSRKKARGVLGYMFKADQIFRIQRTATWQCGYSPTNGFTSNTGSIIYGNGLGLAFCLSQIIGTGNLANPGVMNNVPNYTEFSALFDYYRIRGVHIKVIYTNNVANSSSAVGAVAQPIALPTLQCVEDLDDGIAPLTDGELLQRSGVKLLTLGTNGPIDLFVQPRYADTILTDAAAQPAAVGNRSTWLDSNFPGVQHYGYKFHLTNWPATPLQAGYFQFFFTYDLEFKGVR